MTIENPIRLTGEDLAIIYPRIQHVGKQLTMGLMMDFSFHDMQTHKIDEYFRTNENRSIVEEIKLEILAQEYETRAQAEFDAGGSIGYDLSGAVYVTMSDGTEYVLNDWDMPDLSNYIDCGIDIETALICYLQNC